MKSTSLFLAAAFALCTTAAFAQTTPGSTTSGTTTSGTMNQTPSTGTMNNGTMNNGSMNGTGTMGSDRSTMRSNRRAAKGSKMKSKTSTDGTTKTTM
ncbi:hypothetical protein [Hymenobacter cheonanensis]|uniref:hypothetical protein n=1 Tax=Hymenobacter sp. CA2-7 TaxID=3063993 RepID=UPI00271232F8|nr:hypothetical protein [Hymenobacter sp. CA2-7]MDO7884432.1 hypothetical protein [Hymenobacter sp. CA2-7]